MVIQRGDLAFNCLGASQADNQANDDAQKNSFFGLCHAHSYRLGRGLGFQISALKLVLISGNLACIQLLGESQGAGAEPTNFNSFSININSLPKRQVDGPFGWPAHRKSYLTAL